jgi:hypothetical protein
VEKAYGEVITEASVRVQNKDYGAASNLLHVLFTYNITSPADLACSPAAIASLHGRLDQARYLRHLAKCPDRDTWLSKFSRTYLYACDEDKDEDEDTIREHDKLSLAADEDTNEEHDKLSLAADEDTNEEHDKLSLAAVGIADTTGVRDAPRGAEGVEKEARKERRRRERRRRESRTRREHEKREAGAGAVVLSADAVADESI